ncbi:MAG: hypothetical protein ABIY51_04295 [Ferruginibacter sp.]
MLYYSKNSLRDFCENTKGSCPYHVPVRCRKHLAETDLAFLTRVGLPIIGGPQMVLQWYRQNKVVTLDRFWKLKDNGLEPFIVVGTYDDGKDNAICIDTQANGQIVLCRQGLKPQYINKNLDCFANAVNSSWAYTLGMINWDPMSRRNMNDDDLIWLVDRMLDADRTCLKRKSFWEEYVIDERSREYDHIRGQSLQEIINNRKKKKDL